MERHWHGPLSSQSLAVSALLQCRIGRQPKLDLVYSTPHTLSGPGVHVQDSILWVDDCSQSQNLRERKGDLSVIRHSSFGKSYSTLRLTPALDHTRHERRVIALAHQRENIRNTVGINVQFLASFSQGCLPPQSDSIIGNLDLTRSAPRSAQRRSNILPCGTVYKANLCAWLPPMAGLCRRPVQPAALPLPRREAVD